MEDNSIEYGATYRRNRINIRQRSEPPETLLLETDPSECKNAAQGDPERPNDDPYPAANQQTVARPERPKRTCSEQTNTLANGVVMHTVAHFILSDSFHQYHNRNLFPKNGKKNSEKPQTLKN